MQNNIQNIQNDANGKNNSKLIQNSIISIPLTADCIQNVSMGFQQSNDMEISCPLQTPYTRKWTKQEDKHLLKVIMQKMNGDTSDWKKIIQKSGLVNRTVKQTRYRYKIINPVLKHFKWSQAEDQQLEQLYGIHGNQWVKIQEQMGGKRSANQIRQRYLNVISPKINRNPFSIQEDALILRVMKAVTDRNAIRKWQTISHIIGNGRTSNQLRGRFRQVLEQIWNESSNNIEKAINSLQNLHEQQRQKKEAKIKDAFSVVNNLTNSQQQKMNIRDILTKQDQLVNRLFDILNKQIKDNGSSRNSDFKKSIATTGDSTSLGGDTKSTSIFSLCHSIRQNLSQKKKQGTTQVFESYEKFKDYQKYERLETIQSNQSNNPQLDRLIIPLSPSMQQQQQQFVMAECGTGQQSDQEHVSTQYDMVNSPNLAWSQTPYFAVQNNNNNNINSKGMIEPDQEDKQVSFENYQNFIDQNVIMGMPIQQQGSSFGEEDRQDLAAHIANMKENSYE